jgi:hypothetical protein
MSRDVKSADELELRRVVEKLADNPHALAILVRLAETMAARKRRRSR